MAFNYSKNYYDIFGIYENDGVKEVVHVRIWGNGFKKDLEKIVLEAQGNEPIFNETSGSNADLPNIASYGNAAKEITDYVLSTNDSRLTMVPSLGPGILGLYDPSEDRAYVVKGLSPTLENFVKHHEFGHRLAVYLGIPPTEHMADSYATAVTGGNPIPNRNYN